MNNIDFINSLKDNSFNLTCNDETLIKGETSDFDKFVKDLLLLGYGFIVEKSVKYEGENSKYRFTLERGEIPIKFIGCPFLIKQHVYYKCVNGPQQKQKDNISANDHPTTTKKRFHLNSTKKYNCQAVMIMVKITYFPEYEITENSLSQWRIKKQVLTNLKNDIETGKKISMNEKYLILVSLPSVHNHAIETSLLNLPIDKSVQKEISRLVNNGFSNVKVVQSMLKDFIDRSCTTTPSNLSRAFFPDQRTIRNFIIKCTYEKHQSKIDQNALRIKIEQWKKSQPKDNFYFQPYSEVDGVITPLIFCQQTEWQKYLLDRYGSVCFLDATYKTTKYALPLFLLVVKTNVNYCVVASFFVQYEDSKSIEEALKVIKSWNDTWSPQYFVTDYCEAEYNAINKIFNCPSYICDFHREQAWLRWTNKLGNLSVKDFRGELLTLWRNIADSRDNAEFTEKVEKMKLTEAWLKNPKAQEYFIRTWLPVEEKWTDKFFKIEYDIKVATNNGVESQNKLLKSFYLKMQSDKSLNSIIENIVEQFLPQTLSKYQSKNYKLSSNYKQISKEIPLFLHGRPETFVKHIYSRYATAQNIYNEKKIKKIELDKLLFEVKSESDSTLYMVNFQLPSCTCLDFKKYHWPCKHICALFIYVPGCSFEDLPQTFQNNVFISPDPRYSITNNTDYEIQNNVPGLNENNKNAITSVHPSSNINENATSTVNPSSNTNENISNIPTQFRELLRKMIDLTYIIDEKQYPEWSKELDTLNNVHSKMSEMVTKKNGLTLLPTKRSSTVLLDLPKNHKKPKTKD